MAEQAKQQPTHYLHRGQIYGPGFRPLSELRGTAASASTTAQGGEGNGGDRLPAVSKLAEHIAGLSAEEVQALKAKDQRATAAAIYDARLAELDEGAA